VGGGLWSCFIVVVAEGIRPPQSSGSLQSEKPACGMGQFVASKIAECSSYPVDVRVFVLGHIQRGGIPSAIDRLTAAAFGKTAVDLVATPAPVSTKFMCLRSLIDARRVTD